MSAKNKKRELSDYYKNFIWEAENFFVKIFITSPKMETELSYCLDVIFNITNNPEVDYNKGIIAFNKKYGQCKSFFFEIVSHRYRRLTGKNLFKRTSAKELVSIYKEHGEEALLRFISVRNLFIDDIGDEGEDKLVSHFSNKINVLRFVLLKRYEMWEDNERPGGVRYRTFGTTNLTIQDFAIVYDGRVSDRLLLMTYFREFDFLTTGSFRQINKARKLTPAEIRANWDKLKKPVIVEEIDVTQHLNDLLKESDDYLNSRSVSDWTMIKNKMIEIGAVSRGDYSITEEMLEDARSAERHDVREYLKVILPHATADVKEARKQELYSNITRDKLIAHAEAMITKSLFFFIKENPDYKFTAK